MADLVEWLTAQLDADEAWARAASRPYPYADEGATVPEGGVHWRWVAGEHWTTTNPDPAVEEWVGGEPGAPVHLATVEEWPSSSRLADGTVIRVHSMPLTYANEIVEMDPAAAGHIQRHDPATVLRTIAAHRAILGAFSTAAQWAATMRTQGEHGVAGTYERYAGTMLEAARHIAAIYQDRDGFDPSWKVET